MPDVVLQRFETGLIVGRQPMQLNGDRAVVFYELSGVLGLGVLESSMKRSALTKSRDRLRCEERSPFAIRSGRTLHCGRDKQERNGKSAGWKPALQNAGRQWADDN